ncbi:CASTOR/POLLUX-related putative ion channel [Microbacterium sp. CJ88]|uniref:CASTOR/POLLUX-related putative ion channel n=1 Tax=Microbacterium sp. CJ88 TaxID=3445672 RepID=UPI003F6591E0
MIVILADRDKIEMEETIRQHVPQPGRTRIVCRSGDPMSMLDLQMVSPQSARSVIILPPDDADDPDAIVIKTALALTHGADLADADGPRIVAALRDRRNLEAARLLGDGRAQWLLAGELITRMTVQTARQRGLSAVYTELLDFAGDEIYFTHQPHFAGLAYSDVQLRFAGAIVLGIERGGAVLLNPRAGEMLHEEDQIIVLAGDDSLVRASEPMIGDASAISHIVAESAKPEHTLILGCNPSLQMIVDELAEYVAPGSTVCVAADVPDPAVRVPEGLDLTFVRIDTTSRAALEAMDITRFDHVGVLAYRDRLAAQAADAKTLVTLLHVRDIADRLKVRLNIVSEMLDDRNRELAEVTRADDFIVSDRLISLMLSQISENGRLTAVFNELFSSTGTEIYLRPAALYVGPDMEVDFATIILAASQRGETAIGYRVAGEAHVRSARYGVHVNPALGDRRTYTIDDEIIVLAEHAAVGRGAVQADAASSIRVVR